MSGKHLTDNLSVIVILRGFAAIAVLLYHYICTVSGFFDYNKFLIEIFHYGAKGVQLFFVISSVVIPIMLLKMNYSINQFYSYMKLRLLRIYPPFFIACFILFIYWYLRYKFMNGGYLPNITTLLSNLLFIAPFFNERWLNNIFWTLSVEIGYYVFMGLFFIFALRSLPYRVIFYLSFYSLTLTTLYYKSSHLFNYWALYFLPGINYVLWKNNKVKLNEFLIVTSVASFFIVQNYGWVDYWVLILTLFLIETIPDYSNQSFTFLGKISYSMYLTHIFTDIAIINIFSKYANTIIEKSLLLSISIIFAISFSYLYYKYIELPSHLLSKKYKTN